MKRVSLRIPWPEGLHLRPAGRLARLARDFRSTIRLHANGRMADARSIVSLLLLCAAAQSNLVVEAMGDDEDRAIRAVEHFFASHSENGPAKPEAG